MTDERARIHAYGGSSGALAEIRAAEFSDGPGRGVRYLDIRSGGGLRFDVLIDRALDLGAAEYAGRSFAWRSPTGVRHPAYLDGEGDGFGWLRSFSGLLVTGGLDHIFMPRETDASAYHYPPRTRVRQPLHGRVGNLVAERVNWGEDWSEGGGTLWVEGQVRQVSVFGEHLLLTRRIEVPIGASTIRLRDRVENQGSVPQAHRLLYHVNFGWPLLDEHASIEMDGATPELLTADAAIAPDRMPPPEPAAAEAAYLYRGAARAALVNATSGTRVTITPRGFPFLIEWLNPRAAEYALALEPSTHDPRDLDAPGTVLEPGAFREYETEFTAGPA